MQGKNYASYVLEDIEPKLNKGKKFSKSIKIFKLEGDIAKFLSELQIDNKNIDIGSYPFYNPPNIGTTIIFRGYENNNINNAIKLLCKHLTKAKIQFLK